MMNNPMAQLVSAINSGRNPEMLLQQMARTDPRIAQVMRMIHGKSPQQLRDIAQNMARERGVNIEDVARSLGISIPSKR